MSRTLPFSNLFPLMRIQQKLSARSRYRSEILVLGILSPDRYREQFVEQSMTFLPRMAWAGLRLGVCPAPLRTQLVTTIELVVTTVESVRDSKSERTSLLNDMIVRVKL